MRKEQLITMVEEINNNLHPEIPIKHNTKSTFDSLIQEMKRVVENFSGKAGLTRATIEFLCEKEVDVPAEIKIMEKKVMKKQTTKKQTDKHQETDQFGYRKNSKRSSVATDMTTGKYTMSELMKKYKSNQHFHSILIDLRSKGFKTSYTDDHKIVVKK